jgi:diguanylate cyclase (GGDEF)-like protein
MKDMTPIEDATVLVVDDDPGAQLLARSALELAGFRVVTAQDGVQGLASFNAHSPDCIVLDVIMPGMNGFEMCERVRSAQHGLHVPILMMTSLDDTESVSRAYTVGATDFASKGVNPMLLAQRVKFLVRSKHIQDRLRASEARVRYLAYYDPLTRLPNRQRLVEILEQMIAWATAHNHKIAVMTLNIDDFSRINDILGQTNGDALIAEIALRLQNCLRDPSRTIDHPGAEIDMTDPTDALARIGGDEFALVMPRVPNSDAAALGARRIQAALARPFLIAQQELPVSATIGISFFPDDGADAQALTKNAQAAMHHGKKLGRGGCQFFMQSISATAARHLSLESDLRKALDRREFRLHFQPRLKLPDLRVDAVEALLRWQHPRHGMVAPDEFIPLAEQTGLIVDIGDWVLQEACEQLRRWRDNSGPNWTIAVNVSGVQFRDGTLASRVARAVAAADIDSRALELEFTEGALIEYSSAVSRAVSALREIGCSIALDDFGTGYSSLSYLRRFPIDTLKIDRTFVRDITAEHGGHAPLVDAILAMAQSLGLSTVAEGVESELQLQYLRARGATQVQGFLFSRPLPVDELLSWHDEWTGGRARLICGAA